MVLLGQLPACSLSFGRISIAPVQNGEGDWSTTISCRLNSRGDDSELTNKVTGWALLQFLSVTKFKIVLKWLFVMHILYSMIVILTQLSWSNSNFRVLWKKPYPGLGKINSFSNFVAINSQVLFGCLLPLCGFSSFNI